MLTDTDDDKPQRRSWLERLSNALLREPKDREQLISLLHDAEERNLLDAQALSMMEGVLQMSEMQVRDIMVPRAEMVIIQQSDTLAEILPKIIESAHSRFPVVGDSRDEVVGMLLAKDLLRFQLSNQQETFDIKNLLRPVMMIPESKRLDTLLHEFRAKRNHLAIVVDEYGGVAGLATIEDVLEEIVGDIEDEYDVDDDITIRKQSDTQYLVKALTSIEDFNHFFHANFSDAEVDTIGGIVTRAFGHLPKRGETISLDKFKFKVLTASNRRIIMLRVTLRQRAAIKPDS